MDPDELVEIKPGVTKRLGDLTVAELRAVVGAREQEADEMKAVAAQSRALLTEMESAGDA